MISIIPGLKNTCAVFNNKKHIVSNCKVGKEARDDVACQPILNIATLRFFGKFSQVSGVNESSDR